MYNIYLTLQSFIYNISITQFLNLFMPIIFYEKEWFLFYFQEYPFLFVYSGPYFYKQMYLLCTARGKRNKMAHGDYAIPKSCMSNKKLKHNSCLIYYVVWQKNTEIYMAVDIMCRSGKRIKSCGWKTLY